MVTGNSNKGRDMNTSVEVRSALAAIWEKIKRGEKLTDAEQTAWSNQWCRDFPTKVA